MTYDTYTIKEGESLPEVARRFGMSWDALYTYDGGTGIPNSERLKTEGPNEGNREIVVPRYEEPLEGRSGGDASVYVEARGTEQAQAYAALRVKVVEASNKAPINGAKVELRKRDSSLQRSQGHSSRRKTTHSNGEVVFHHLPPTRYRVRVRRTGFRSASESIQISVDRVNKVTIKLRSKASIQVVRRPQDAGQGVETAPAAEFARIGLWDQAYCRTNSGLEVRNEGSEQENFVGLDTRRFYFRVRDPSVPKNKDYIHINWKTLHADGSDDCAPESQRLILKRTQRDSDCFLSKAVMLTSDDVDQNHPTHSGYDAPAPAPGMRTSGDTNHRMRKVTKLGGFVKGKYRPASGGTTLSTEVPTFHPQELRRLPLRIVNYGECRSPDYIEETIRVANNRWKQAGLQIYQAHYSCPPPPDEINDDGVFREDAYGMAALVADLVPQTPDNTVTAVFVPMRGLAGYAITSLLYDLPGFPDMGNRAFVLISGLDPEGLDPEGLDPEGLNPEGLNLKEDFTLAHELYHILFNRGDVPTESQYFTFNTAPPEELLNPEIIGPASWPDVRLRRRIQNGDAPRVSAPCTDPDNDPECRNILNWVRREHSGSPYPTAIADEQGTPTTGNKNLLEKWNPYQQ